MRKAKKRCFGRFIILLLILNLGALKISGQVSELPALQGEAFLHPADAFTAYTLQKGEFVYCQSPFTLPLPSWAWWGITDRITAEIDLLPLLGGYFVKPHLPVPSFNFRFRFLDEKGLLPTMALESMYQHLWTTQHQVERADLKIGRDGANSWYNHLNFNWKYRNLYVHLSSGVSYTENLILENADSLFPVKKHLTKALIRIYH